MRSRLSIVALICLMMNCVTSQDDSPSIRVDDCAGEILELARAHSAKISCMWLLVPEYQDERESRLQFELFLLRLGSQKPTNNAPILHLPGGPGFAASSYLANWLESDFHQDFDIILLDQRGAGLSYPSLECNELDRSESDNWVRTCRERMDNRSIDLSAFASTAVVRDLHDLLLALGAPQVNVYGHSYGTRLALMLADIAPQRIRSMVLDGVYPPPVNATAEMARNTHLALEQLFNDCETDTLCNQSFPHLRDSFYRAVLQMNATPVEVSILGKYHGAIMDGDDLVLLVRSLLQEASAIPYLPDFIASFALGEYDLAPLIEFLTVFEEETDHKSLSEGIYFTVRCSEDLSNPESQRLTSFDSDIPAEVTAATRKLARDEYANCRVWGVSTAKAEIQLPISSAVPTLLLSGAYDPATPQQWGEYAAKYLQSSWHFVFPNLGHDVLGSEPCAAEIMQEFLADPSRNPTADCFSKLQAPGFQVPEIEAN